MKKKLKTENNTVDVDHIIKTKKHLLCHTCCSEFLSNNYLHKHIWKDCVKSLKASVCIKLMKTTSVLMQTTSTMMRAGFIYVKFIITETTYNDYSFWRWHYVITKVWLTCDGEISSICLNTECTMTLLNKQFLKKKVSDILIQQMLSSITVCGLSANTHKSTEFVIVTLYLLSRDEKITVIFCETHLINNLKACMLIKIDILTSEKISLNLSERKVTIESCDNTEISLTITTQSINQINQLVYVS